MPNNIPPLSKSNIFSNQVNPSKNQNAHWDVRQDKRALTRARIRSGQPARSHIPMRAQTLSNNTTRSQKRPVPKRRTVHLSLWIEPIIKAEIQRRADRENLSISSVGSALLRKGMQADLDMEYGALLTPVFENILDRRMSARDNRLALLLVRVAFATEQTRNLVTNILGRQPNITPEILTDILDHSAEAAKAKITKKTPQLEKLIAEVQSWFNTKEKKTDG